MSKVQIRNKGIKKATNSFSLQKAITEYIWNGFDALADNVDISYNFVGTTKNIKQLFIKDNGTGINRNLLKTKFSPFFESEKDTKKDGLPRLIKGKNGYGRFTFHKFSPEAIWETVYRHSDKLFEYSINIKSDSLDNYSATEPIVSNKKDSGTKVIFERTSSDLIEHFVLTELKEFLVNEFAWFLEIHEGKKHNITIKNKKLRYDSLILDEDKFVLKIKQGETEFLFNCKYVQWAKKLNDEYSSFYFTDSTRKLFYSTTTKLNKKSDNFHHSIYIESKLFDFFMNSESTQKPEKRISNSVYKDLFNDLQNKLNNYLRKKRRPFLKIGSEKLIEQFESEGILPEFSNNSWDVYRKRELTELIRQLYEVEPKLFHQLNTAQKKILVRLFNRLLEQELKDDLFQILAGVIDLDDEEVRSLSEILKVTKMNNIVSTIKLIKERFELIEGLKKILYDREFGANEVDHLQKYIENHFWIFGEQFNLISYAEDKFAKALKKFRSKVYGSDVVFPLEHEDRNREMDIFMVRQNPMIKTFNNVVIELKHPTKTIGQKEFSQVKKYFNVILEEAQFNADNFTWEFILVGNKLNKNLKSEFENAKHHGEKSLVFWDSSRDFKIYIKRWSEVINELELRLGFLNNKLEIERNKLSVDATSPNELILNTKELAK